MLQMNKQDRRQTTSLLIILLLAAFWLRLFRLDAQSLWWDEGISLNLAVSSLREIIADRVVNIHPPLYFFGLKGWVALTGLTPFTARYASVLASWLQVTAVYAICRRWFGRSAVVWTATGLIAISPLSVIYGQETRVYAFLPLIYLALLAVTSHLIRPSSRTASLRPWLWLGLVEWLGLHLHYVVMFLVIYITVWAFLAFYRQRRWPDLYRWLRVQIVVGLASLPWFAAILSHWTAVQAEANAGTFFAEPAPLDFLIAQVWGFHLTGLAGALGHPEVIGSIVLAALGVPGLLLLGWRQRQKSLPLLAHWLIPLSLALVVWSVRSFSHPRYIGIYAIGLIPLAASLITSVPRRWWAAWLGVPLVLLSLWGLWTYFFDPAVAKDDMRGAADYLEMHAAPDDFIIVPDAGWAFPLEYQGETAVGMPSLTQRDEMWPKLGRWSRQRRQIFTVMPAAFSRDWQDVVAFALEEAGALVDVKRFDGLVVRQYVVDRPISPPLMKEETTADFGALRLVGNWVETGAAADSAVTLALSWEVALTARPRLQVDVTLLDVDGWPLAHTVNMLVDAAGRPTDQWPPGQRVTTYHIVPLPPGTPPLTYTLALSLLAPGPDDLLSPLDLLDATGAPQGQRFSLTDSLNLSPLTGRGQNPYAVKSGLPNLPEPVLLAPGLTLLAAGIDRGQVGPGQPLFVSLKWLAAQTPLPDLRPQLLLTQPDNVLAVADDAPALGRYPTDQWQLGEQVLEHRRLQIPATAEAGTADVVIMLDDTRIKIGEVAVAAEDHLFAPPPLPSPVDVQLGTAARLVGYELAAEVIDTAVPFPLTLYWQSLTTGSDVSYTVFAHILAADGRLIGQHDAPPANGTRLTTGWVADEYIIDRHELQFREPDYRGAAQIEVGLYDPDTGVRLTTPDGQDHFILPVTLQVTGGDEQ